MFKLAEFVVTKRSRRLYERVMDSFKSKPSLRANVVTRRTDFNSASLDDILRSCRRYGGPNSVSSMSVLGDCL
jgi:hypothetical protein